MSPDFPFFAILDKFSELYLSTSHFTMKILMYFLVHVQEFPGIVKSNPKMCTPWSKIMIHDCRSNDICSSQQCAYSLFSSESMTSTGERLGAVLSRIAVFNVTLESYEGERLNGMLRHFFYLLIHASSLGLTSTNPLLRRPS